MEKKKLILKKERVNFEAEKRKFLFQTHYGEPILSFTPKACYFRAINRPLAEDMFKQAEAMFYEDQTIGWELNNQAREFWREIIRQSNEL